MQTADTWWSDVSSCLIPGPTYPSFPYNYDTYDTCGGSQAVVVRPLVDARNVSYGTVYIYRNYGNRLLVTIALDGSSDGQYFLQAPLNGEGMRANWLERVRQLGVWSLIRKEVNAPHLAFGLGCWAFVSPSICQSLADAHH